tara:strand:- start:41 stop:256 length:216 start_codon:yes stop_codon:yes gene_type:complete
MKIHVNLSQDIFVSEIKDVAQVLIRAFKNDGHLVADVDTIEWLSTIVGTMMHHLDVASQEAREQTRLIDKA